MAEQDAHYTSLTGGHTVFRSELGEVTRVTADDLPILDGLSIKRLVLSPNALRAPHWHANCAELAYCVAGRALVTILGNDSAFSVFEVTAGQMFFVESGALHAIDNVGETAAEFIIAFRHERPEDFMLQGAFGAMSDAVLGNAYSLPASAFAGMPRTTEGAYIVRRAGPAEIPADARRANPHRFDVEAESAPIDVGYGQARLAGSQFGPALKDIAMYPLRVTPDGRREPHWHPGTAEMGYVLAGHARMTLLSPGGKVDTWELAPGDVYFIPPAYPHHIEVLDGDEIRFLIFFDQDAPGDIGYRASASAFGPGVLAAALGLPPDRLPAFPDTPEDPLIVRRMNPRGHFDRAGPNQERREWRRARRGDADEGA
ncbi:cupin domain-containing protein [Nostoc sp. NIES-2111]